MDSKKRVFCAIFRHFEVPRDGFNSYRIRKIAFISKRLAEKFYCMVQMLQFLPNLKGQVVWSLLSDVWPHHLWSTPCFLLVCFKRKMFKTGLSFEPLFGNSTWWICWNLEILLGVLTAWRSLLELWGLLAYFLSLSI